MTDNQRKSIKELRENGYGYTAIAKTVGLSKDSVKAYCRSHGLGGVKAESNARIKPDPDRCLNCGSLLLQRPKTKKKKFCCPACRQAWWNSHPEQVNQRAVYHFHCPTCGKDFTAYGNNHRKYCSHECYINARFKGGDIS